MPWREQRFTSPGTWTNPGTVKWVEVWAVGGGGGAAGLPLGGNACGGGGAVRWKYLPVTGPAPVVIGAGGTASGPLAYAGVGGTTTFNGPSGLVAGGGGAGVGPGVPAPLLAVKDAPPTGGGGGESQSGGEGIGAFGTPGWSQGGGGAGGPANVNTQLPSARYTGSQGVLIPGIGWFGGGGVRPGTSIGIHGAGQNSPSPLSLPADGVANSGGGASGSNGPTGASGGSGFCVVRWWE